MADMLEVEGQLDGPAEDHVHDAQSIAGTEATETFSTAGPEGFYNSKKSSTWKKLKKMVGANTHSKAHGEVSIAGASCSTTVLLVLVLLNSDQGPVSHFAGVIIRQQCIPMHGMCSYAQQLLTCPAHVACAGTCNSSCW